MSQPCSNYGSCSLFLQGHEERIGSLEDTSKEILPALGKVVQAVENFSEHFTEIKSDLKAIKTDMYDFKVTNASYGIRLSVLEEGWKKQDNISLERRVGAYKTVLTIAGAVISAALIYWFGFK